jgi:oxygen-independent coproporphyrinogen-3 oxidase
VTAPGLSLYVHVPFCASRCGYCDFNTYTATELGNEVSQETFHRVLIDEVRLAAAQLAQANALRTVQTVFFGGGTPTLIGAGALAEVLRSVDAEFGLAADAEITTEANPESIDQAGLETLRAAGFTRISIGMQSASSHVLRILDRRHTPGASTQVARAARQAGFAHVNLDLIYGTPGESEDDLRRSLDEVLAAGVDHVSAYALIVEEGTGLARRIRAGELPMPDQDVAAARYEVIDEVLDQAGLEWYEVSNWAGPGGKCRHNRAYWGSEDWWGIGPGAHSHLDGVRWWNLKHPRTYADALAQGRIPEAGRERLTAAERRVEQVMLGVRTRTGIDSRTVDRRVAEGLLDRGLIDAGRLADGSIVLTRQGRLLADAVIRELLP